MDDATSPSPPPGYQAGYAPPTAVSWWELLSGEIGVFVGTVGLFGWLTVAVRDGSAVFAVFWRAATLDSLGAWGIYGALVGTIGVTLVLHETFTPSLRAGLVVRRGLAVRVSDCMSACMVAFSRGEQMP